jgi:hypothetical protein
MKTSFKAARFPLAAALSLLLGFGCQSIAGVEDVSFDGSASVGALCDDYCDLVMTACPGDLAVYADRPSCMTVCGHLEQGNKASPSGNTVACRAEQAREASMLEAPVEKAFHCPSAGPGGGEQCSPKNQKADCEGYCALYTAACVSISKDWGFGTIDECVLKCAGVPPADYAVASAAMSGDTLACRILHATQAFSDPEANCAAAGLRPQGDCLGDPNAEPSCEDLCLVGSVACAGDLRVFENPKECVETCERTAPGNRLDSSKLDTRACRSYHAYNALLINPMVHCPHIGPGGDGVCSDATDPNCKPYCRLAKAACPTEYKASFDDDDAKCMDTCRGLEGGMGPNGYSVVKAQSGATLQCRTLRVTQALAGSATACAAAFGGDPCD